MMVMRRKRMMMVMMVVMVRRKRTVMVVERGMVGMRKVPVTEVMTVRRRGGGW